MYASPMLMKDLSAITAKLETDAGASTAANNIEDGYWQRVAIAAEDIANATTVASPNQMGRMLRAALALEAVAGTSGAQENHNYEGYLKRIVDALEVKAGAVTAGSMEERFRIATLAAVFNAFASYALADRFTVPEYWVGGTQYTPVTALPGYSFTRTGSQGAVDASGAVAFYAANVPAINSAGYHAFGALTNNLLNAGGAATLATQNVTTTATAYTLAIMGTGSVALSGAFVGNLAGTGATNQVSLNFTSTAGTLTLTVTGSVTYAVLVNGTFTAPGVPIIATAGTTMAIGESVFNSTLSLTNADMLVFVRFEQLAFSADSYLAEYKALDTNRIVLRTQSGAVNAVVVAAGANVYNQTISGVLVSGQATTIVLRRLGGDWRVGKYIAGVLTWGLSGAGAFPTGMNLSSVGNYGAGGAPAQAKIRHNMVKLGTFTTDAEVIAKLDEAL